MGKFVLRLKSTGEIIRDPKTEDIHIFQDKKSAYKKMNELNKNEYFKNDLEVIPWNK